MEILNYFGQENQAALRDKIAACPWGAVRFLTDLLEKGTFYDMLGGWGDLYLLVDGEELVAFGTLTGQDAIRDESMTPWIGFVFVQPEYRGHRYSQLLLNHCEAEAAKLGYSKIYIGTDHIGLYEKYGYIYMENRLDYWDDDTRILFKELGGQDHEP